MSNSVQILCGLSVLLFIQADISYKPLRRIAMEVCTDTDDSQIRKLIEFDDPTSR